MQRLECSQAIVNRFFEAIDYLKENRYIRGTQTFTSRYDINRRNFITTKQHPESGMFEVGWMMYIVNDYDISAEWLLTGQGSMKKPKIVQNTCK